MNELLRGIEECLEIIGPNPVYFKGVSEYEGKMATYRLVRICRELVARTDTESPKD